MKHTLLATITTNGRATIVRSVAEKVNRIAMDTVHPDNQEKINKLFMMGE